MKLQWLRSSSISLSSTDDLLAAIETVRLEGRPTLVHLEHDGRSLWFGVGAAESVLTWAERDGETFHSVGDLSRKGVVQLWNCGQLDDFIAELAVPENIGIEAAVAFAATGERPTNVRWESDG
jgi:hypothetical protein